MGGSEPEKQSQFPRVLADLHWITQAMTCDHGRETVVRTGEAPSLGPTPQAGFPPADRIALTGEVSGGNPSGVVPRLNRRPYGRDHGAQWHGDSGGDHREVSEKPIPPLPTPARLSSSLAGSVAGSRLYPRLVVLACSAQGEAGHEAGSGFRVAHRSTATKRRVDLLPMTRRLTRI